MTSRTDETRRGWRAGLEGAHMAIRTGRLIGLLVSVVMGSLTYPATALAVTGQELRDAILERVQVQPSDLAEFDVNRDGVVDVADLVAKGPTGDFYFVNASDEALGFDYMFGDPAGNLLVVNASPEYGYRAVFLSTGSDPVYFRFNAFGALQSVSSKDVVVVPATKMKGSYGIADSAGNRQILYSLSSTSVTGPTVARAALSPGAVNTATTTFKMLEQIAVVTGELSDFGGIVGQLDEAMSGNTGFFGFFKDQASGLIIDTIKQKVSDKTLGLLLDRKQNPFVQETLSTVLALAESSLACVEGDLLSCLNAVSSYSDLMDLALQGLLGSGRIQGMADFIKKCMTPPVGIFDQFGCMLDCELEPPVGYCPDQDSTGGKTPYHCVITGDGCVFSPDSR